PEITISTPYFSNSGEKSFRQCIVPCQSPEWKGGICISTTRKAASFALLLCNSASSQRASSSLKTSKAANPSYSTSSSTLSSPVSKAIKCTGPRVKEK